MKYGMVRGEAGGKIGLPRVTMVIQHLPRYGGQRSTKRFSERSDIEYMQGAGTACCSQVIQS